MYRTPWREEKQPSMKVSLKENLWVDYGNGNEGGTLLDLVLRLHPQQTVSEALQHIYSAVHSFSFQKQESPIPFKETSGIQIESIKSIGTNRQLNVYLQDRGIDLKLADRFCSEVYFKVGDKSYFGIGHENENGWSIRNKFWKGCSAQGITLHRTGSLQVAVFEGIFDMLSYKQLASYSSRQSDLLILNSTSNLEKGMKVMEGYEKINLFLDNDRSGNDATLKIMDAYPFSKDKRWIYSGYKDFNDLLVSKASRGRKLGNAQEASHVLVRPKRLLP